MPEPFEPGYSTYGSVGLNGGLSPGIGGLTPEDIAAQILGGEQLQPEPPPRFVKAEKPPPPTKKFQEHAKQYISEYCRASRAYMKTKEAAIKLDRDLFDNKLTIEEWRERAQGESSAAATSQSIKPKTLEDENRPWSQFVFSVSHLINAFAANAVPQILEGPDWLTVIDRKGKPQPKPQPDMASWQIPPEMMPMEGPEPQSAPGEEFSRQLRVQNFLLQKMEMGQIEARLYEAIQSCVVDGTVYAQVFPVVVPQYEWWFDTETGEYTEQKVSEEYYVVLQQIPLNRVLVDPLAKHNDVQRYRGIGHRIDRTYEQILQDFDSGIYSLNRAEFEERWAKSKGKPASVDSEIDRDEDTVGLDDPDSHLQVWSLCIKVPTEQKTLRECVCAIVTEQGVEDPSDGILVRLDQAPIIKGGLRPYACAHFIPRPGPLGMGMPRDNQELIYAISQFIGQLVDNTRMCAVGAMQALEGPAYEYLKKKGYIGPLEIVPVSQLNGELAPVPMPTFQIESIFRVIQWLVQLLEQRTVTAVFQGQNQGGDQTATGEHLQYQQSMRPATTITDLICRTLVQPLGRIALKMLAQMTDEPQDFSIQNAKGEDIAAQVTPEDFEEGDYDVVVTLTHQDSTKTIKAQTIRDIIETIEKHLPRLNAEGTDISLTELYKRLLDLLNVDGSDRVVTQISTKEQAMQKQIQEMQQALEEKDRKPPTISIPFEAIPIDGQIQALGLAGINVGMESYMGLPSTTPPDANLGMMPGDNGQGMMPDDSGLMNGNGGGMGNEGGPMGEERTDQNANAQMYQENMRPGAQTQ